MGDQRNRAAALCQMRQHTGRSALGFVFCVGRLMQQRRGCCVQIVGCTERDRQRRVAEMRFQRIAQRLGLKALQHREKRGFGIKEAVGWVTGRCGPRQRDAAQPGFNGEYWPFQIGGQRLRQLLAPGRARGGRHGGGHAGKAPGGFDQPASQQVLLRAQTAALQQRRCRQHVDSHVHAHVCT